MGQKWGFGNGGGTERIGKGFSQPGRGHGLDGQWLALFEALAHGSDAPACRGDRALPVDKNPAHVHLRKIRLAFAPPKPNELDSAVCSFAPAGRRTNLKAAGGIGRVQRSLRGKPLAAQRHQANSRFDRSRCAEQVADASLWWN